MKLSKKSLFYFLMLFPYIEPLYLSTTAIEPFLSILRNIFFAFSVLLVINHAVKRKNKYDIYFFCAIYSYFILLLVSTLLSPSGNVSQWYYQTIVDISICNITFLWIKNNYRTCISYLLTYLELLLSINIVTLILFPNGMYINGVYKQWFLGYDNTHIRWMIPALTLSLIWSFIQASNGKWKTNYLGIHSRTILLWGICLCHIVISASMTSIVAFVSFTGLLVLLCKDQRDTANRKRYTYTMSFSFFIAIVGTVIVALMANLLLPDLLESIQSFFNKNIEVNRMIVWRNAIISILRNPVLGVGLEIQSVTGMKLMGSTLQGSSAHNYILNVLYQSGLAGFILFVNIYRMIGKRINDKKGTLPSAYLCIYYSIIAIMGLSEPQHGAVCLYIMWCVGYFVPDLLFGSEKMILQYDNRHTMKGQFYENTRSNPCSSRFKRNSK